ncbi:hypothetical protein L6452_42354 [Arctium lappa]|uniref:Uncharacterized protein n=1 Tax=Arctium lappa TaxID=4217 RepID=A0ACB8XHZ4_ARCLA|nr:hypothetical protein L6452_42354 [Arctium lappa]
MPKCTRLKDAKEHTHVKMPMCTMLKDANEHTSHDTWGSQRVSKDLTMSRLQHLHDQVDQDHQGHEGEKSRRSLRDKRLKSLSADQDSLKDSILLATTNSFVVPGPNTKVHSRSFKRGVSSRAQATKKISN